MLIGINLLREGIDVPEVSLVAILDADKEGFLRNPRSLIQTIGRAARNSDGHVIMYADKTTRSMKEAMDETARRREIQTQYNVEHGITPTTIKKDIRDLISVRTDSTDNQEVIDLTQVAFKDLPKDEQMSIIGNLEKQMKAAAKSLDFEEAAQLRDNVMELKAVL